MQRAAMKSGLTGIGDGAVRRQIWDEGWAGGGKFKSEGSKIATE
jgi:hypothetical protein